MVSNLLSLVSPDEVFKLVKEWLCSVFNDSNRYLLAQTLVPKYTVFSLLFKTGYVVFCFILESYAWYHLFTCGTEQCCDQLDKLIELFKV